MDKNDIFSRTNAEENRKRKDLNKLQEMLKKLHSMCKHPPEDITTIEEDGKLVSQCKICRLKF